MGDHIQAWTPEAEAQAEGAPCSRFDLLQADSIAADIDVGWGELAIMSSRRVRRAKHNLSKHLCEAQDLYCSRFDLLPCGSAVADVNNSCFGHVHADAYTIVLCCRPGSCSLGWRRRLKRC